MSSIDGLLAEARARAHKAAAEQAPQPRLRIAILTCMDARIDPVSLFGLGRGDAHVIRNAGARATPDVLRSLALSQAILGTSEVLGLGWPAKTPASAESQAQPARRRRSEEDTSQ